MSIWTADTCGDSRDADSEKWAEDCWSKSRDTEVLNFHGQLLRKFWGRFPHDHLELNGNKMEDLEASFKLMAEALVGNSDYMVVTHDVYCERRRKVVRVASLMTGDQEDEEAVDLFTIAELVGEDADYTVSTLNNPKVYQYAEKKEKDTKSQSPEEVRKNILDSYS